MVQSEMEMVTFFRRVLGGGVGQCTISYIDFRRVYPQIHYLSPLGRYKIYESIWRKKKNYRIYKLTCDAWVPHLLLSLREGTV